MFYEVLQPEKTNRSLTAILPFSKTRPTISDQRTMLQATTEATMHQEGTATPDYSGFVGTEDAENDTQNTISTGQHTTHRRLGTYLQDSTFRPNATLDNSGQDNDNATQVSSQEIAHETSTVMFTDFTSNYTTGFDHLDNNSWIGSNTDNSTSEWVSSFPTTNSTVIFFDEWKENFSSNERWIFHDNDSVSLTTRLHSSDTFINGNTRIDSSAETIAKVFFLALVSIFGSIGNFLVVGSIIKSRHLHRPPFYFLLSMGVTDLSRAGFCLPVVMATSLQGSIWRHGPTACKIFAFAASFFVFSSALSLLTIAIERHISIVYTKAYRRRCHGFINLFATLFIWAAAFSISFPPVFSFGMGDYVFISEEAQCTYDHKHYSQNDGLNSVLIFLAIMSLTYFLYYRIFIFMRSHRRMRPLQQHRPAFSTTWTFVGPGANGQAFINWLNGFGGNNATATRQPSAGQRNSQRMNFGRTSNLSSTKNQHLTRLFLIMTSVHGVTWLPYVVLSLWRVFLDASNIPPSFMTYAAWLSYSQVAICPLAYFLSRGPARNTPRIVQTDSCERNEFLLENKIRK